MYIVNKEANRINPISKDTFSNLDISERKHLQEWLAYQPDALGEELLIIQKEFDGFNDTNERLDLLALDKDGNLVIIENKLDDSGRDVVWQALKYASYCANLTKSQIVDIYQQYLERYQQVNSNAIKNIIEFLGAADLDEVKLNLGNSQRIILVAANFRKEVTSTAIWLLIQGINIQCFKVTPYLINEQILISIDQIVPMPEAKDLMIGINAKEIEEKNSEIISKNSEILRRQYWEKALISFQESKCNIYNNISPSKDHWLSAGSGVSGCPYNLNFLKKEIRVELSIARNNADENKQIYDYLFKHKDEIEQKFGSVLEWQRLDDKKMSRIQFCKNVDGYNSDNWDEFISWHIEQMTRLDAAFNKLLRSAADEAKILSQENKV